MNKLSKLIKTGKSIFSIPEMVDSWQTNYNTAKATVYRMVKAKNLIRIKKGLFTLSEKINLFELGCKLVPGSYISLFTVLKKMGVIFQEYSIIYLVAPRPQTFTVANQNFTYHKIKPLISIPDGIEFKDFYSIAILERAILDTFYLFDTDYSDFKITSFDKKKFIDLSKFYNKKTQCKASSFLKDLKL